MSTTARRRHGRAERVLRAMDVIVVAVLLAACGSREVPTDLPRTPTTRGPATATAPRTSGGTVAVPQPTGSATPTRTPVIVIDPGHSGRSLRNVAAPTRLRDIDYPNYPEIYEMYDVSFCMARALRAGGYRVVLTKTSALASASHAARARIADRAHADLAISVHDDHGAPASFQATYSQRGVRHGGRYHGMYRGRGDHRTVFRQPAVARVSEAYARTIASARTTAQRRRVTVRENSFDGRAPLEPGNLALVQLLSHVPWVYNEAGAKTAGSTTRAMSIGSEEAYAAGLVRGVEAAVPAPGGDARLSRGGFAGLRSCLVRRVEPRPHVYTRPKACLPDGLRGSTSRR